MSLQVYGCNLVAIEVGDVDKAVAFSQDVFGVEKLEMNPSSGCSRIPRCRMRVSFG